MRYYKIIDSDGFVAGFGTNGSGIAITEKEFQSLTAMFTDRPTAPVKKIYILRDNPYEWVLVDAQPEPELTDDEAMEIIPESDTE